MSSTPAPTAAAQQSSSKNRWKQLFRVLGVVVAVTLVAFLSVRLWMIAAVLGIDQFGFVAAVIQSVLVFGLIAYIFRASDWTGFQGYEDITEEIDTSVAGAKLWKAKTRKPVRGKTLWDWMQLLAALAVPLALGLVTISFNNQQAASLLDQQRETALQSYLDHMSDLLLGNNTGKSIPLASSGDDDEICQVARSRTLSVLQVLDGRRKGVAIKFLYSAGLIGYYKRAFVRSPAIVFLSEANLSDAHLEGVFLIGAELYGADLSGAYLTGAHLQGIDLASAQLGGAHLNGADLKDLYLDNANLSRTDLSGAQLGGASLSYAKMNYANLSRTILVYQGPRDAYPKGANLNGADLTGADLTGADLRNTSIMQQQINQATTCKDTLTPDGITHSQDACQYR